MSTSPFSLTDRVAIVTGGGRGIGKAAALGLAQAGCHVVVTARTAQEIEASAREIQASGARALAITTDVRDAAQVQNLVDRTLAEFGRIDVLVNNAGGARGSPFMKITEHNWESVIKENLTSVFLCTQAVVAVMRERKKGSIINISSAVGIVSSSVQIPYAAAKAGVMNFTRSAAAALAHHGVRVNCIAPGIVETPGVIEFYAKTPGMREEKIKKVPLGRLGKPEDISGAIVYLASDASSFMTGHTMVVDGGMTITYGE